MLFNSNEKIQIQNKKKYKKLLDGVNKCFLSTKRSRWKFNTYQDLLPLCKKNNLFFFIILAKL